MADADQVTHHVMKGEDAELQDLDVSGELVVGTLGSATDEIGNVFIKDDATLSFGSDQDASMEYDEDGTNTLLITGPITFADGTDDVDFAAHDGTNGLKLGGTLVAASAAEINGACDLSARYLSITTAKNVENTDNGKTFGFNHATGFAATLPAPSAGMKFKFVVETIPTSGNSTIKTDSDANIIHGQIACSADGAAVVTAPAADIINFVASTCIVGDYCEVESDGTNWYVSGLCALATGMTTVQTA